MRRRVVKSLSVLDDLPDLPLDAAQWQAIVEALGLSARQADIAELVLRGACDKQIATVLGIRATTLRTYRERIAARTSTRNRMELAMKVLAMSHQLTAKKRPLK